MKAAVLEKAGKISIQEKPKPECSDNKVIIKIKEVGLCGSDVHFYNDGRIGDFVVEKPIILGHESSGTVVEVGKNVKGLKVGDRVSIEPGIPCYKCEFCKIGKYNLCSNVNFMACPPCDGAFQEYIEYDPNFVFKISDKITFTEAALVEPFSVAYYALKKVTVKLGSSIFILGAGPIGLAVLELAKVAGITKIFISDIEDYRLKVAKDHGADFVINPLNSNILNIVSDKTNGRGVDVAIEAAGSPKTVFDSLKVVKKGGSIIWISVGKELVSIPYQDVVFRELKVEGINRYANTYGPVIELFESKKINFDGYVTHRFKFEQIEQAFKVANDSKVNNIKIMIEFD